MRIKSLKLQDYNPIRHFEIQDLGNAVIIAGANGSGKTRLKQALVEAFRGSPVMDLTVAATRPQEEEDKYFGAPEIQVVKGSQSEPLQRYINSRTYGSARYVGSLVQIDSDRSVQSIKYQPVNWLAGDPDDVEAAGTYYFNPFPNRWREFMQYIHQKAAARDKKLAEMVKAAEPQERADKIREQHPDPLEKYQRLFKKILPDKELLPINPASPSEFRYRTTSGQELPFNTLSSGEQEVIKILFDVARKDIRHSVIVVDEPELHLHPTLAFQLIEALKDIGDNSNQYLFLTHSSDLISTYYATGDVYFIDSQSSEGNQACRLRDLSAEHPDLARVIGNNLGLFAVGKKLVFVEGDESSIDRLSYQKIAQAVDPDAKVMPIGSVTNIMALTKIEEEMRKSVFGIDLFMIRDRDGLSQEQIERLEVSGRLRVLRRRHIENYFLDADTLAAVAERLYITKQKPHLTADYIRQELRRFAEESVGLNTLQSAKDYLGMNYGLAGPRVPDPSSLEDSALQEAIMAAVSESAQALTDGLGDDEFGAWLRDETTRLRAALDDGTWISTFQGKHLFRRVCTDLLDDDAIKIQHAYIDEALANGREPIKELVEVFEGWK